MEWEEFAECYAAAQARAAALREIVPDVEVFEALRASGADLKRAEDELGVRLPGKYKEFMRRCGGGMVECVEVPPVVSADETVEDLVEVNRTEGFGAEFVAVAPVGTGDYWGFAVVDGICRDQVSFRYHEDGIVEDTAADFLEFVSREGLRVGEM